MWLEFVDICSGVLLLVLDVLILLLVLIKICMILVLLSVVVVCKGMLFLEFFELIFVLCFRSI